MDNQNRTQKKFRFTVFDLLIILLIIACVAGIIVRHTILERLENATAYQTYYIYFEAASVSYDATVALESTHDETSGENWIYLSDGVTKVGNMTKGELSSSENLSVTPSDVYIKGADGKTVRAQYADIEKDKASIKYDVKDILVICEGFVSSESGNFLLNGKTHIAPGTVLDVQTKYGDFSLKVASIEPITAE